MRILLKHPNCLIVGYKSQDDRVVYSSIINIIVDDDAFVNFYKVTNEVIKSESQAILKERLKSYRK